MGTGWQLGLIAALVATNALLAGSEVALVSLREGQLRRLSRRGGVGQLVVRLAREPNRSLATARPPTPPSGRSAAIRPAGGRVSPRRRSAS